MKQGFTRFLFVLAILLGGLFGTNQATAQGWSVTCPASTVTRLYVDGALSASGNGSSWTQALTTVSQALAIANQCPGVNEIWVKAGTYYPMVSATAKATSRDSAFRIIRNGIKLYGGFAGTESTLAARNVAANPTILSGDLGTLNTNSDNSYHVVTVVGGVTGPIDTTTRIDGFTISHGNAVGGGRGTVYGIYAPSHDGGGVFLIGSEVGNNSSPVIANSIIADNQADVGGGAYAGAYHDGASSPYFLNCTIRNNWAYDVGGIHAHASGPFGTASQQPRYYNCRFLNNTAASGAAAVGFYNYSRASNDIYMAGCVFEGNAVSDYGGAINTYTSNCHFTMVGCIFTGNRAGQAGGAMSIGNGGSATMRNCTFSNNTATSGAATINQGSLATITLENSIVWGASTLQVAPFGTVNYRFSDVRGISAPTNSLSLDPLFVNASDPDGADNIWGTADDGLQLQRCSPLIDKGSNPLVPAALTTDFAGAARSQQLAVDMGAYETPWINSNLVISTSSSYDPSTCSGTDGRIGFGTVPTGLSYTINYSRNGVAQLPVTAVADASGLVFIPNLSAGRYNAFSFTLNGCTSNGPVVNIDLIDPPLPLISNISGTNPTTCGGQSGSVTLTGLTNGITYLVNFSRGGVAQPAQTLTASSGAVTIQNLTAGRYTDFTVTVNNCTSPLVPGPVILNDPAAPATPVPSSNAPVCSGAALNLNAGTTPAGASYSWSGPNGFTSTTQNPVIASAQAVNAGTYQLVVSVANCPSAAGNVNVVVNPLPQNVVAASNSPVCEGSALQLTGSSSGTGATFAWTGPGGFTANTAIASIPAATVTANGTYALRVTNASGTCATTVLAYVTIQPIPAISGVTGANPTTCNGTSGTLTISGLTPSTSYSVAYLNGTVSQSVTASSNAAGAIVLNGIGRGSYSNFVVTINGCSSASFAGPVVLTDPPAPAAPAASSNTPVCETATLNLSVTGAAGATYSWTGPNSFSSSSATPSVTNMTSAKTGTYSVTQTVNGCVSAPATTTVAINALPAQPGTITGPASPCLNSSNAYSVNGVTGATSYVWTLPATWTSTGSTSTSISAATGTSGGTISVAAVNGCGAGTARTLTVTVNNVPAAAGAITGPTAICDGVATGYSIAAVSNASSYTWVLPGGWTGASTSASITATPGASSGAIQVIPNNVCGSGNSAALNVSVTSTPARPGAITGNATPCVNTPQLYYISSVNGAASYNWTFPSGGTPAWSGSANTTSLNAIIGTNSGNVSVTATNQCGTSPAATLAITVTQLPSAAGAITGPAAPCVGTTPAYSVAQVQNATSYNWTFPSSWSGTPGSTNSIRLSVGSGSGTITVTPVGVCGNGAPSSIQVSGTPIVTPTVSMTRSTPGDTICGGTPVTFRARATNAGPNPVYEFRRNGILLASGASDTFRTSALANGDRISVTVISSLPCVNTSMAKDSTRMFVLPVRTPGININTFPPTVLCAGQTVTLYSNDTNGGANPRYDWYLNGEKIEGVTSRDYTPSSVNNGDTFQVILTSDVACAKYTVAPSNKVGFSVTPVVTPTVSVSMDPAGPIMRGVELTFTATASNGGANPQFQWFRNGAPISGATGSVWKSSTLVSGDEISVRMLSVATCATPELVMSNGVRVTISSTGIANATLNASVRLYPNPNTGHFIVEVRDMAIKPGLRSGIAVLNPLGQIVYHVTFQPDRPDWSHDVWLNEGLANGTYLLRVYSEQGGATAIPFILNR